MSENILYITLWVNKKLCKISNDRRKKLFEQFIKRFEDKTKLDFS